MTILTLVQKAYKRLALQNAPSAVVTSQDPQVLQFLELANEEGQTLAEATNWQSLVKQATFLTVAAQQQALLPVIAPGCKFIVNDTIWNQSLRFPVFGPLSPQTWAQQKAMFYQGPWNQFRIFDDAVNFIPTPVAGQTCNFEYITKNWTTGGTSEFTDDAQSSLLDEDVMVMGLIWRFKEAKGLDFSSDLQKYTRRVADMVARETPKPILALDTCPYGPGGVQTGSGVIGSGGGFMPFW